jgi:dTDP-4-amino-4,6-dideoxygalactose transaminase
MGFNSRLDTLQAAVLAVKLPHLDAWNARRNEVAMRYRAAFAGDSRVVPIDAAPWTSRHAYHLFVVRVPRSERDSIVRSMHARGIGVGIHYPIPIHRQDAFAGLLAGPTSFPVTEALSPEILSLPVCGAIGDDEVETVISEMKAALDANRAPAVV